METGSLEQDCRDCPPTPLENGRVAVGVFVASHSPTWGARRLACRMAETVSAFKKPRISAVVGRFDRASPSTASPLGRPLR